MKLVKSLLLGSAAGLCAAAGAQAADLPMRKAAPVEYVRVCTAYGAGFFFIPGTDTCLRVGGRARFDYQYTSNRAITPNAVGSSGNLVNGDVSGFLGRGRLNLDARTQTAYGTLRAFVRFEITAATGGYLNSGTAQRFGTAFPALGQDTFGRAQTQVNVDKAFIQFAGITAGRAASFFDFYGHELEFITATSGSDVPSTNLAAYTFTFGNGFSATIAAEDPLYRRQPVFSNANYNGAVNTAAAFGIGAGPGLANLGSTFVSQVPILFTPATGGTGTNGQAVGVLNLDVVQRERLPDFVGALRYDAPWGAAQASAAVHEIFVGKYQAGVFSPSAVAPGTTVSFGNGSPSFTNPATGQAITAGGQIPGLTAPAFRQPGAEYGYGVQGGLKINLPQLAAGDVLWLQAAYSEGALSYSGIPTRLSGSESNSNPYTRFAVSTSDAVVDGAGRLRLTEAFAFTGAFLHYFTPEVRGAVFGSYGEVNFARGVRNGLSNGVATTATGALATGNGVAAVNTRAFSPVLKDYTVSTIGGNLIYSPVRDLDIGVEAVYQRIDIQGRVGDGNKSIGAVPTNAATLADGTAGRPLKSVSFDDVFLARFRVQRDF